MKKEYKFDCSLLKLTRSRQAATIQITGMSNENIMAFADELDSQKGIEVICVLRDLKKIAFVLEKGLTAAQLDELILKVVTKCCEVSENQIICS